MKIIGVLVALANRHRPVLINGGVGFITFSTGDALSQGARPLQLVVGQEVAAVTKVSWQQQFADRTKEVDFARSAKVGLLGIALNGFALGAWYRVLDRYLGAERTRMRTLIAKCAVDQMVYAPFSITSFVGYATALNGGGIQTVAKETAQNLRETFWSTWLMDWKVWPAANFIMFRFIPSSYRPSFASIVQVAWQTYMSSVSYDSPHHAPIKIDTADVGDGSHSVRGGGVEGVVLEGKPKKVLRPVKLMTRRPTTRYAYMSKDTNNKDGGLKESSSGSQASSREGTGTSSGQKSTREQEL